MSEAQAQSPIPSPHDLRALQQELRELLRRAQPESDAVLAAAQRLLAVHDDGSFLKDGAVTQGAWSRRHARERAFLLWLKASCELGLEQGRKYLRVARAISPAEVVGKRLGIEALNQIALADLRLRPALFALAHDEQRCAGALAEGRLAGTRVLARGGDYEEATLATKAAAAQRARRQDRAPREPARRPPPTTLAPIAHALAGTARKIEVLLRAELPAGDDAQARVRVQLAALQAQCARLALRLGPAPAETTAARQALGAAPGLVAAQAAPLSANTPLRAGSALATNEPAAADPPAASSAAADPLAANGSAATNLPAADPPTAAPSEEDPLTRLAARGARFAPLFTWLLALPPRPRELLLALQVGVLIGTCTARAVAAFLDERLPHWDLPAPPEPSFQRWRDALARGEGRLLTALCTLASVDLAQLLFTLPLLLERLARPEGDSTLDCVAPELRALAARYGTTVAYLRLAQQQERERKRGSASDT